MSKNYTFVLLELRYFFKDSDTASGWEYWNEGGEEYWIWDEDTDVTKEAKEVHKEYGAAFTVEHTTPVRVGSKAALLKYAKQFAYNHPEGTRIIQVQVEGEEEISKGQLRESPHNFELFINYSPRQNFYSWEIKDSGERYERSDAFDSEAEARVDGERQLKWLQENS